MRPILSEVLVQFSQELSWDDWVSIFLNEMENIWRYFLWPMCFYYEGLKFLLYYEGNDHHEEDKIALQ